MPRFYVEKDGEWNIFSTITDDFVFDEFVCLDALKARLIYERYKELTEDIDSLLTDRPRVNVMSYSEAIERICEDEPQTDCAWKKGSEGIMTIDQAIKKCKRYAESYDRMAKKYEESDGWFYEQKEKQCRQDSVDFYQIMHWLEELQGLKGN